MFFRPIVVSRIVYYGIDAAGFAVSVHEHTHTHTHTQCIAPCEPGHLLENLEHPSFNDVTNRFRSPIVLIDPIPFDCEKNDSMGESIDEAPSDISFAKLICSHQTI